MADAPATATLTITAYDVSDEVVTAVIDDLTAMGFVALGALDVDRDGRWAATATGDTELVIDGEWLALDQFATTVASGWPNGTRYNLRFAPKRAEHEACQRGTVGCSVDHATASPCETW